MKFKKTLSSILIAGGLYLGILSSLSAQHQRINPIFNNPPVKIVETTTPKARKKLSEIVMEEEKPSLAVFSDYDNYMNTAKKYSEIEQTRAEAVKAFKQAIRTDRTKAFNDSKLLTGEAAKNYKNAIFEINTGKNQEEKENKSSIGTYLLIGAGVAAIGGLIYLLTQKKAPSETEVTLTFDVNKSFSGYQKELASRTVKSGSSVDIPISELGIAEIDPKYVAVYSEDFKKTISFDSDGSATFTAPSSNAKYHIMVFDSLGVNRAGDQVLYDWINGLLYKSKRNHVVFRKDYDGQTMPERVWGGEALPEIGGKNGVFDQINEALTVNYNGVRVRWGSVDRQPTATTGDASYGAGDSEGADGYHYGDYITVNAKKLRYDMKMMLSVGLEEAFELLIRVDNIGGYASRTTITDYYTHCLNDDGKKLLLFAYIKDSASFTSSSSGSAAVMSAVNALDVSKRFGPVEIGLNSGRLRAGLRSKDGRAGVRTDVGLNGGMIDNYTSADFTTGALQGNVNMSLSPSRQSYNANSTLNLKGVVVGVSGGYDANSRVGNLSANVGAKVGDGNVMVGVAGTPGMFGFNAQASQALKDIGIIGFRVMHTKNRLEDYTSLGLDARLDKVPVSLMVDYDKFGLYENLRLGLGARILGGTLSVGLDNHAGRKNLAASYTVSIPVK